MIFALASFSTVIAVVGPILDGFATRQPPEHIREKLLELRKQQAKGFEQPERDIAAARELADIQTISKTLM